MLNKEYRRGRIHAQEKRLKELPNDIESLFDDILRRGGQCPSETLLCIQWVLYARRSLRLEELYFAVLSGSDPSSLVRWEKSEITREDMERFLLDASKGLLEQTKAKNKTFQFIHESVREFFLTGKGLGGPPFAPADTFSARSHKTLMLGCWSYCNWAYPELTQLMKHSGFDIHVAHHGTKYYRQCYSDWMTYVPFLEYAAQNALAHCEAAGRLGVDQSDFLNEWNFSKWVCLSNVFQKSEKFHKEYRASVLYALADENLLQPMRAMLIRGGEFEKLEPRHQRLVLAGLVEGDPSNLEVVTEWLLVDTSSSTTGGHMTDICNQQTHSDSSLKFPPGLELSDEAVSQAMMSLREYRRLVSERARDTTLLWAARHGHLGLVQISLADPGCFIWAKNHKQQGAYELAVLNGHVEVLRTLLSNASPREDDYRACLHAAVTSGNLGLLGTFPSRSIKEIVLRHPNNAREVLTLALDVDSRVNWNVLARWLWGQNFCSAGAVCPTKELCTAGLDRTVKRDILFSSASYGDVELHRLLLEQDDIDVNASDMNGQSQLGLAAQAGHTEIVQLLLHRPGTRADIHNARGDTPLILATHNGHVGVVKALLKHGNIGLNHETHPPRSKATGGAASFTRGVTALALAVCLNYAEIVEVLLAHDHIDVNAGFPITSAVAWARSEGWIRVPGDLRVVTMLLDRKDIDQDQKDFIARVVREYNAAFQGRVPVTQAPN